MTLNTIHKGNYPGFGEHCGDSTCWCFANGVDAGVTKPSNPKDVIGSRKLDLMIVPWTLMVCAAGALLEGALKYGRFNWRICGVRASIYISACKRHLAKWENGQDVDAKTHVHHLDSAIACLTIMRDAALYGKMTDDRAPCPNPDAMANWIDAQETLVSHLKSTFAGENPHQYTIADTGVAPDERTPDRTDQERRDAPGFGEGPGCPDHAGGYR